MRILHLLPHNTYGRDFISLLDRNPDEHIHFFRITYSQLNYQTSHKLLIGVKQYFVIFFAFLKYDKVFCHGLFDNRHNLVFLFAPFVNKKLYWILWGWDLYLYKHHGNGFKQRLAEFIRKLLFKRVRNVLTSIPGDFELFKLVYNNLAKHHVVRYYLPIRFSALKPSLKVWNVLVGNSASATNNHVEAIERLISEIDLEYKTFYFPLSYGNKLIAENVIKIGNEKLKDYFVPITEYMQYDNYIDFLKRMDVAIMYHDNQEALGNIFQLLALGKKVYLRSETTHFVDLTEQGFKIFDANDHLSSIDDLMSTEDALKNIKLVKKLYSEEKITKEWSKVFSYQKGDSK